MGIRSPVTDGACALIRFIICAFAAVLMLSGASAHAIVFANDSVIAASATALVDEHNFDGVGRVVCIDQHAQGVSYMATGWVLGSADTVVTAAHALFPQTEPGQPKKILNPRYCMFILYGPDERVRGYARVRYALSPWSETRLRYDSSYDVAVLKLDRPVPVASIPTVRAFRGGKMSSVELAAFHTGVAETHRVRVTQGTLRAFPAEQLRNDAASMKITSASRLFTTSAASTPGSSGGMYYDVETGTAIGLHIGRICDPEQARIDYDPAKCFNYGLRFDAAIIALVNLVAQDNPTPTRLVIADRDTGRMALAPREKPEG